MVSKKLQIFINRNLFICFLSINLFITFFPQFLFSYESLSIKYVLNNFDDLFAITFDDTIKAKTLLTCTLVIIFFFFSFNFLNNQNFNSIFKFKEIKINKVYVYSFFLFSFFEYTKIFSEISLLQQLIYNTVLILFFVNIYFGFFVIKNKYTSLAFVFLITLILTIAYSKNSNGGFFFLAIAIYCIFFFYFFYSI